MNNYYLTLVLKADMDEAKRKALIDTMTNKLLGADGKIDKADLWGNKELAYPIKRQTKGYFAHFEITADPKDAKDLDRTLKVEDDILRYLLMRA